MNMLTLGAAAAGGQMGILIFIVIMFIGMYFISIRPQKKQQQKRQEMLKEMSKGDKVVTLGGIKGVVASIDRDNKEVVVDCDGIYLTFDLNFIRRATPAAGSNDAAKKPVEEKNAEKANESTEAKAEDKTEETAPEEPKAEETAEKTEPEATDDAKDDTKEETK